MKILILSASPSRDKVIDELIAAELTALGHEVKVRPCLREGRAAITDEINSVLSGSFGFIPEVVVTPPIRNPYSRDMVETLKSWGLGVVSRHTEPSCDKADFEKMDDRAKMEIFGKWPYEIDAELVWSQDEADILNQRKVPFQAHAVGAFAVDPYKRPELMAQHRNKEEFCKKFNFDPTKKTLLICSPWGFADTAPDLHIEDLDAAKKDQVGRDKHFAMIRQVCAQGTPVRDAWNILITCHPGVVQEPYKALCTELGLSLDTESTSFYLSLHCDAIVHAGSTMAVNAHLLEIPAFQFGDCNAKDEQNWWADPTAAISKVSPYFTDPLALSEAILASQPGSNANMEAITTLEKGRYGLMDGKATARAAEIISGVKGAFKFCWPSSTRDYSQLILQRDWRRVMTQMPCKICGKDFYILNESYRNMVNSIMQGGLKEYFKEMPPPELWQQLWQPPFTWACPHCSARFFSLED